MSITQRNRRRNADKKIIKKAPFARKNMDQNDNKPQMPTEITVGVLALQGAFHEHLLLLHQASTRLRQRNDTEVSWKFTQVRNRQQLEACDALIIPGGESTAVSLVAVRSGLLEPLREFVKVHHKPTWGTCAGLILLAESANRTKKGGQELIGGLDVRVNRNYFGRQAQSFERELHLPFLEHEVGREYEPFKAIFIRAPVVEKVLASVLGAQMAIGESEGTVVAPPRDSLRTEEEREPVKIMGTLPPHSKSPGESSLEPVQTNEAGQEIIAVMQHNCFGTSFHPELTQDPRIHIWWLEQVKDAVLKPSQTDPQENEQSLLQKTLPASSLAAKGQSAMRVIELDIPRFL